MIRSVLIFVMCIFVACRADALSNSMQIQMLDAQIAQLTAERDAKREELAQCRRKKKGVRTAGIITLGTTAVGATANILLAKKISNMSNGGFGGGSGGQRPAVSPCSRISNQCCTILGNTDGCGNDWVGCCAKINEDAPCDDAMMQEFSKLVEQTCGNA